MPNVVGCHFAHWAASKEKLYPVVLFEAPDSEMVESLNAQIELAASQGKFFLALFPTLMTDDAVSAVLLKLGENPRWKLQRAPDDADGTHLFELFWKTAVGPLASVIGFGPFPTMPLTRRAPLIGFGLWGGGHENSQRTRVDLDLVGIGDMNHGLPDDAYKRRLDKTRATMRELKAAGLQDEFPPTLTFRLPRS